MCDVQTIPFPDTSFLILTGWTGIHSLSCVLAAVNLVPAFRITNSTMSRSLIMGGMIDEACLRLYVELRDFSSG